MNLHYLCSPSLHSLPESVGVGIGAKEVVDIVAPLSELSSWIRGCDCHEELRLQGKSVDCP